jgi:hypothetical protein
MKYREEDIVLKCHVVGVAREVDLWCEMSDYERCDWIGDSDSDSDIM